MRLNWASLRQFLSDKVFLDFRKLNALLFLYNFYFCFNMFLEQPVSWQFFNWFFYQTYTHIYVYIDIYISTCIARFVLFICVKKVELSTQLDVSSKSKWMSECVRTRNGAFMGFPRVPFIPCFSFFFLLLYFLCSLRGN